MTENHSLGLRASSMGHRNQLNHIKTPPPPVLSNASAQVRGCKNEHQGKPWRKRAQRATVDVGVNTRRREEWQPGSPRRQWDRGMCTQILIYMVGFPSTRKFKTLSSSAAAWQRPGPSCVFPGPILPLPKAKDLCSAPGLWEFAAA